MEQWKEHGPERSGFESQFCHSSPGQVTQPLRASASSGQNGVREPARRLVVRTSEIIYWHRGAQ